MLSRAPAWLNIQGSFFAIENPLRALDRWLHPTRYRRIVRLQERDIEINWTRRANDALARRDRLLIVELRLYFSCVIKKQVHFHDRADFATVPVNHQLSIAFRPFTAAVCDPREFAARYPVGRDLSAGAANRMLPRVVDLDFRHGRWEGRFAC